MYLCVIMKEILFKFLDLKYSGKTIVIYSYSNDDASCQIYYADSDDSDDFIMEIHFSDNLIKVIINDSVTDHILKYMNLSNTTIESYILEWCRTNVRQDIII